MEKQKSGEIIEVRYLVTTADERTWPENRPILFLGEWCRLFNRKDTWENLDAKVVPYHWNDRSKLYNDYKYLKDLNEELLTELTKSLNKIHSVNYSLRYWRILIGPWLGYFVQILYDRWEMIERAVSLYEISEVSTLNINKEQVIPKDMGHFQRLFISDQWNEAIYSELIRKFTNIPVNSVDNINQTEVLHSLSQNINLKRILLLKQLKKGMIQIFSFCIQIFKKQNEPFIITSHLPMKWDLLLQLKLGQFPKLWRYLSTPQIPVNLNKRNWLLGDVSTQGFDQIVRLMIPQHIPTIYLEGFSNLQYHVNSLPWPRKPKFIFTSNSYSSDDGFKAWAAGKVEIGIPLVIGQHGGGFGTYLWAFYEDQQIAISDSWLSWGWDDIKIPKIKPMTIFKTIHCKQTRDPNGEALMVTNAYPRYSYHMYSIPVASQWLNYFNGMCLFIDSLPTNIQQKILLRLYPTDYGWCQKARWQERFPNLRIDKGASMKSLIKKTQLHISTYNGTTFLESLSMNVPTIMFWDSSHWELRNDAIPYYNRLKEVGIFHESPESAAIKVSEIWDDINSWWDQPEIQTARKFFCRRFARNINYPIDAIKDALTGVESCQDT